MCMSDPVTSERREFTRPPRPQLIFTFFVVAHLVACMWWAVGNSYWGFNFDTKGCTKAGPDAPRVNCGFLGEGNFSTPWMLRMAPTYPDNLYPDEDKAQRYGPPGTNASSNEGASPNSPTRSLHPALLAPWMWLPRRGPP